MAATEIAIPIEHPELASVSAAALEPEPGSRARASAVLLAHGAGAPHSSPFMTAMARGLAARGFPVLAFHYPYMEQNVRDGKRRGPDRAPLLEATHRSALAALEERFGREHRPLLAGKSLGGRIGTHLAAKGADCAGLVLFGYPLHPPGRSPGRSGRVRSEHFPAIAQPALFLQGTRDPLCDLELLRTALRNYGGQARLEVIEGGDHSFAVPKKSGRAAEGVLEELLDRVAAWESATFPD